MYIPFITFPEREGGQSHVSLLGGNKKGLLAAPGCVLLALAQAPVAERQGARELCTEQPGSGHLLSLPQGHLLLLESPSPKDWVHSLRLGDSESKPSLPISQVVPLEVAGTEVRL